MLAKLKALLASAWAKAQSLWSNLQAKIAPLAGYANLYWQKARAAWSFLSNHPVAKAAAIVLAFLVGVHYSAAVLELVGRLVELAFEIVRLAAKLL